jgi:VWFA-related protein
MKNSRICSVMVILLIASFVRGQQPSTLPAPPPPAQRQTTTAPENQDDVVRISTNLVQVDVVVTKDGKPVTDLTAEDFEILEDDKPQQITNFSYISNIGATAANTSVTGKRTALDKTTLIPPVPLKTNDARRTMAIVVDDLALSMPSIARVKDQVRSLIETMAPNDLVAIIRTGGDVGALQQFTNDRRMLLSAVDRLKWNPCSRVGLLDQPPAGQLNLNVGLCAGRAPDTFNTLRFIVRGMSYLPGRKSLVILSNDLPIQDQEPNRTGEDVLGGNADALIPSPFGKEGPGVKGNTRDDSVNNYEGQLRRIAELAIRGSVVIYAVDARGLQTFGPTAADSITATATLQGRVDALRSIRSDQDFKGRQGADLIAKQTGGFLIKNSNDFGLSKVMTDQEGYYLIGFRPGEDTFDRRFHHLKARLKRKGLTVRTRAGFYGFTDDQVHPADLSVADQMKMAVLSPFAANDLTVRLTTFFVNQPAEGSLLRSFVYLNPRELTFTEQPDGWRVADIDFKGMVFGDNGKIISEKSEVGTVRLRGAAFDRAMRDGIVRALDLPISQVGPVQFRVAVRDSHSSHIGSAGQFVEVPDVRRGAFAMSGLVVREISTTNAAAPPTADDEKDLVTNGPAVRRFRQGAALVFAFAIYNAGAGNSQPRLTKQTRVFHDGKVIYTGEDVPVDLEGQPDLKRISNATLFKLGTETEPGEYVFQIIVTDSSTEKPRKIAQSIDFEVVK